MTATYSAVPGRAVPGLMVPGRPFVASIGVPGSVTLSRKPAGMVTLSREPNLDTYISGELVRTIANFVNSAGSASDPTTTALKYKSGSGSTQTPSNVHDGTGQFHYDIDTSGWTGPGNLLYVIQWAGTGAVQAIGIDSFEVEPTAL